jgi:5'-methylthioadenosine phosphorylase
MSSKIIVGIIGGSGFEDSQVFKKAKKISVKSPYGNVSALIGSIGNKKIVFIPRHGFKHTSAPHLINYRANISALKKLGVTHILATAAVGSLTKGIKPGTLALLYDFIDFTKSRVQTFFDRSEVIHVDMTKPYDSRLNALLTKAIKNLSGKAPGKAVYAATEGPRFETAAEIKMYAKLGAHVVGMTNSPEVVLAKELSIPYATVAVVTNYGCGLSKEALSMDEVIEGMEKNKILLADVLTETIKML